MTGGKSIHMKQGHRKYPVALFREWVTVIVPALLCQRKPMHVIFSSAFPGTV